jgi:peptide/nickel transport system substrate-binding protein
MTAHAATRPRYGGNLRVETTAAIQTLDPAQTVASADTSVRDSIVSLIADTLVALDQNARPVPRLATRWQSENGNKRWQFWIRPGVFLHNGASLTPAHVAQSLTAANPAWKVRANSESVTIDSELPSPNLSVELSRPLYAILARADELAGTGPFRVEDFQPGRRLVLRSNDDYWLGRPYLDTVAFAFSVPLRDQAAHQQLGQADVIELSPDQVRRAAQENRRTVSSPLTELIVILIPNGSSPAEDQRLRQAISLAVDRAAINSTLLQRQGEPTAALLPSWVSGYSFLFSTARDIARARQLRGEVPAAQVPLTLSYDPADALLRSIAERVAVNVRDAGILIQPVPANG